MLVAVIVLAAAAAAAPSNDSILVTGTRTVPEVTKQAIRQITAAPVDDRIARWRTPVCVGVIGVVKTIGDRVTGGIEAMARDAIVPLARRPCKTNALVSFTQDGAAVARSLNKKRRRTFAATSSPNKKRCSAQRAFRQSRPSNRRS